MTVIPRFRRIAGFALGAILFALPAPLAAQTAQKPVPPPRMPSPNELSRYSLTGSYLAARHAAQHRDAGAAAAFYRSALKSDPRNSELLGRAFLSMLAHGEIDEAVRLADQLLKLDRNDRVARLVVGVRGLRVRHYITARTNLAQSVRGPVTDLAATLLVGWAWVGSGEVKRAIETVDKLQGAEWYALFKDFHAGLMLDMAGQRKEAGRRYERAFKLDPSALRLVQAYASWMSRNGDRGGARKLLEDFNAQAPRHPLVLDWLARLESGKPLPPLVETPQAGAGEVLYGIGSAIGRRGGEDLGLVYLQLGLYLSPNQPLALLSLADLHEQAKNPWQAARVYERVPKTSPLRRNAEIQLAVNLDLMERTDEARKRLDALLAERPDDVDAIMALGNILRGRKAFPECADVYGRGIATIKKPERPHWLIYYFRGICFERAKQWAKAEPDLQLALKLYPDQAHVLNYLGYSWIDQGVNLDEGMRMIRRAVEQRPDDGYIVDSLGWAYYRLGNYQEALRHLERAVELRPDDPTINDHLGDVYWKVGRELEARFQWSHARDLKPEPEELKRIEHKLKYGLTGEPSSAAEAKAKKPGGGG